MSAQSHLFTVTGDVALDEALCAVGLTLSKLAAAATATASFQLLLAEVPGQSKAACSTPVGAHMAAPCRSEVCNCSCGSC
jgi:hypothetical protein